MDIFKLLTRGIKEPTRKAGEASVAPRLPSSGTTPNAQLFHDTVGGSRGVKRKRAGGAAEEAEVEAGRRDTPEDDADIDFFAPKQEKAAAQSSSSSSSSSLDRMVHGGRQTNTSSEQEPEPRSRSELLDEDECRRMLKSHRLKLTVLAGRVETKGLKKGEKAKTAAKGSGSRDEKKDEKKQQLYPQPLASFAELRHTYGVAKQLVDNVTRQGFREPTEVQMGSLPLLLRPTTALSRCASVDDVPVARGVDFMAVAPTGSGKTVTFLIPAIDDILRRKRGAKQDATAGQADRDRAAEHVLSTVVVAPTRELASQIVNEGRKLAIGTGVRVVLMRRGMRLTAEDVTRGGNFDDDGGDSGGGDEEEEEDDDDDDDDVSQQSEDEEDEGESDEMETAGKEDEHGRGQKPPARVDILVTTPKLLLNFLCSGKKSGPRKKVLPTVTSLVLDEADVLLDPVFRKQTMAVWRACIHPDLRSTFWSATMASGVESLIATQLARRALRAGAAPARPFVRLVVGIKDAAVPNVTHRLVWTLNEPGKLHELRNLLHPVATGAGNATEPQAQALRPPFLIFTQTIERAQALHDEIKYDIPPSAGGPSRVAVLHSGLRDGARRAIMARFRAGEVWVLITTDVLARGVDFVGVNGVVNYDVPASAAAYVHRAGRTGRAGREGGVAVTFWTKEDIPFLRSIANVIAASEKQAGGSGAGVQDWLLAALPKTAKAEKRRLKVRGVEARRAGASQARITTKSAWERRREHNRQGAIEGSRRRKKQQRRDEREQQRLRPGRAEGGDGDEWGGFED